MVHGKYEHLWQAAPTLQHRQYSSDPRRPRHHVACSTWAMQLESGRACAENGWWVNRGESYPKCSAGMVNIVAKYATHGILMVENDVNI